MVEERENDWDGAIDVRVSAAWSIDGLPTRSLTSLSLINSNSAPSTGRYDRRDREPSVSVFNLAANEEVRLEIVLFVVVFFSSSRSTTLSSNLEEKPFFSPFDSPATSLFPVC